MKKSHLASILCISLLASNSYALPPMPTKDAQQAMTQQQPHSKAQIKLNSFPVITKTLTPGEVKAHPLPMTPVGAFPAFFIIGDDAQSKDWLKTHLLTLQAKQALGIVVNVHDQEAMTQLQALAPGLPLIRKRLINPIF